MLLTLIKSLPELNRRWKEVPLMERDEFLRAWGMWGLPMPLAKDVLSFDKRKTLIFLFRLDPTQMLYLLKSVGLDYSGWDINSIIEDLLKKDKTERYHNIILDLYLRFVPVITPQNKNSQEIMIVRNLDYWGKYGIKK